MCENYKKLNLLTVFGVLGALTVLIHAFYVGNDCYSCCQSFIDVVIKFVVEPVY